MVSPDLPQNELLHRAKQSLGRFGFVGIVEHWNESIQLLEYQLQISLPRLKGVAEWNAGNHKFRLNRQQVEHLESTLASDIELYEAALSRFWEQRQKAGSLRFQPAQFASRAIDGKATKATRVSDIAAVAAAEPGGSKNKRRSRPGVSSDGALKAFT